ncbi:B3 DNA binding domain [Dillenia turbinata]|uniref:B3 DNA binding domain n=1 Tax=Dillenia turbinata TaxID=194707 RepID=A0AAN8YRC3_9MAGN
MADSQVASSKPHFFKSIPPLFLEYLNGQVSKEAVLRSYSKKVWRVKVKDWCFEDGWTDFVKDHDLHVGDFLVFRYEGDMAFNVLVFDPSACEKKYTWSDHFKMASQTDEQNVTKRAKSGSPGREGEHNKHDHETDCPISAPKATTSTAEHGQNPIFVTTLKPSSISMNYQYLPKNFAKSTRRESKMILRDENQGTWPMSLIRRPYDGRLYIQSGWKIFRKAKGLNVGDTMKFELIKKGKNLVINFQVLGKFSPANRQSPKENVPKRPYFTSTIKQSYLDKYRLTIPRHFTRSNGLINKCGDILLKDQKGRSWPAKMLCEKSDNQIFIGRGWSAMAKKNCVKEGDEFMLELIGEQNKLVMKYHKFMHEQLHGDVLLNLNRRKKEKEGIDEGKALTSKPLDDSSSIQSKAQGTPELATALMD